MIMRKKVMYLGICELNGLRVSHTEMPFHQSTFRFLKIISGDTEIQRQLLMIVFVLRSSFISNEGRET
ncbi:hypothetical protein Y032_0119g858 [Ancylostoma ceylanicum]|uniref:Uncharacterized protein n=1 Tax=Ancylostoma ceylanicum TaxID=53326 RepID=A0A016TBA9_9BILA|nr:hypothetical protein Y032_0119g858 [Ancylostoma ceylanicum]